MDGVPVGLPWVTHKERRRARKLYDVAWVRNRHSNPRPQPNGTVTFAAASMLGPIDVHFLAGRKGKGTVVLAHPDRRYGGHWFVREGWVDAIHASGRSVAWFDQPGYGQGTNGSPYLGENIMNVTQAVAHRDKGPVDVVGLSLGSFAAAIAAPYMPWVRRIVLESPYRTFTSWYDGRGMSAGRIALNAFKLLFRNVNKLDTQITLAAAPQEFLVGCSDADDVTPARLSRDAIGDRDVEWVIVSDADHLGLWHDATYRQAVLDFLA